MKKLITLLFLCSTFISFSQEISRSTQSSAGASTKNNQGYTIEWTMGAQFSQIVQSGNHLTEGFQQGDFQKELEIPKTSLKRTIQSPSKLTKEKPSLSLSVYPNPTMERLSLKINEGNFQDATITVFDINGKQLLQQNVHSDGSTEVQIHDIEQLKSGQYILHITTPLSLSQSIPFVKVGS